MTIAANLKRLREGQNLSQPKLAKLAGVSQQLISQIESGTNRTTKNLPALAKALGVSVNAIDPTYTAESEIALSAVPLMGFVGAGAEVEPDFEQVPEGGLEEIIVPFPMPAEMIALQVRGDSMLPMYEDGMVLIVFREQHKPIDSFYGRRAVVRTEDGRRFVKTILRGAPGTITLASFNAAPIENVRPAWIGEIWTTFEAAAARAFARRVAKQGGIQGRLGLTAAE